MSFGKDNFNKGGRPKGARNRLSHAFVTALAKDFEEHGPAIIKVLRVESPVDYCRLVAGLVPKELEIEMNSRTHELREWMVWLNPDLAQSMATRPRIEEKVPDPVAYLQKPESPRPGPVKVAFNASEAARAEPIADRPRLKLTPREAEKF